MVALLIVDDDCAFRERLAKSFCSRGFETRQAANLAEVKKCVEDYKPTHAVIDLCLKQETGLDAVSLLVEKFSCKTVVLTGYSSASTALEAVRRGAINYLSKPVMLEALQQALFGEPLTLVKSHPPQAEAPPTLADIEWEHIQRVLRECDGNITHAAKRLGLHRQALQRKLRREG